jgi:AraC-like DNA-binding protein
MDVLSAVLRELRLVSAAYRRLELRAPWRLAFKQAGIRGVHVVVRGRCELLVSGAPNLVLEAGDLVMAPRADAHELCSLGDEGAPVLSPAEMQASTRGNRICVEGPGTETIVLCGAFFFDTADHPALSALPRILHVPGEMGRAAPWLATYIDALTAELLEDGPGSELVAARLSDALIARALRFHVQRVGERGWLRGLRDPHVAKALSAMHAELHRPWTLVTLARTAGLSRAAFAARFAELVGETPMRYLLARRMRKAMDLLQSEGATLTRVAEQVGYGSEAALSAAFKRYTGHAPGAFARAQRRQHDAAAETRP